MADPGRVGDRAPAPTPSADKADQALRIGREHGDRDLEIMALTRPGAWIVSGGVIAEGLSDLHEAMTAATSGQGHDANMLRKRCAR